MVTATSTTVSSLEGAAGERETLLGLDGRPLSSPDHPLPVGGPPKKPSSHPISSRVASATAPAVNSVPAVVAGLAAADPRPAPLAADRSSQERVHVNLTQGAVDPALLEEVETNPKLRHESLRQGASSESSAPVERGASVGPSPSVEGDASVERSSPRLGSRLRRHPALWFVAGCACTMLLVGVARLLSTEPSSASAAPSLAGEASVDTSLAAARPPTEAERPPMDEPEEPGVAKQGDDAPEGTADQRSESASLAAVEAPMEADAVTEPVDSAESPKATSVKPAKRRPVRVKARQRRSRVHDADEPFIPKGL